MVRKTLPRIVTVLLLVSIGVNVAPEALAFPYARTVRGVPVRSTAPIGPEMEAILARADALDAASPLTPIPSRRIFLTDGGWRWMVLSLQAHGAFALTRPLLDTIVVNRSDMGADAVWNGAGVAGRRTLTGVIAHETVHRMIAHHFGLRAVTFSGWKVEGYADHVARESSLSDADAARLRREGRTVPALLYYDGRRRVAAALAGGMSVEALFRGDRE